MTPQNANPMIQDLETFVANTKAELAADATKFYTAILKPAIGILWSGVQAAWQHLEPELPGLALSAITAVATTTGDKKTAALKQIVSTLGNDAINSAVEGGADEATAIANQYGVSASDVNLMIETGVSALKAHGVIS